MRLGWNARAQADPLWHILSDNKYRNIFEFNRAGLNSAEFVMAKCERFLQARDAVLDIGCGVGRVLKFIAPCFVYAWGVDVSDEMIRLSKDYLSNTPNAVALLGNGYGLPVSDTSVDLAYSMFVFEHFPEKRIGHSLIAEAYRVLVKGGLFLLRIAVAEKPTDTGTSWNGVQWTETEIRQAILQTGFVIAEATADTHANPAFKFLTLIGRKP
jgi:ubiquinone/menaquinone biosynthesis C-methylase UbiE